MVQGIIAGGSRRWSSPSRSGDDLDAGSSAVDERRINDKDVVVGIAASGTTPFVRAALGRAQALGARTVFLSCTAPPPLITDTCDECITVLVGARGGDRVHPAQGRHRHKLVLNLLTTGAMVRLGKTYGNLMVDLQVRNQSWPTAASGSSWR